MEIRTDDYINVRDKLESLGVKYPGDFALIPTYLDQTESLQDLRQQSETDTVFTLFREAGLNCSIVDDVQPAYIQNNSYEWFGPTIFITAALIAQEPNTLSIALGLITNYLDDVFRGKKDGKVTLEIVNELADGSTKKVSYSGDREGLEQLPAIIASLNNGG